MLQQCFIFLCINILLNSVSLASDPTQIQRYGHHVSVRVGGKHTCSGSIISSRFVLTTYWCISTYIKVDDITVVAGTRSHDIHVDSYKIDKIFTPHSSYAEIVLLRTEKNIILHNGIQTVPIATNNDYDDDSEVSITGWEHLQTDKEQRSDILQHFSARLFNKSACSAMFEFTDEKYLCTYNADRDICNLEEGGAIVFDGHQIGIYLKDDECYNAIDAHANTPIYPYVEWIQDNMKLKDEITPPAKKFEYDATPGAYPYQVSIRHNNEHVCSGSIIHKRHILTSIKCIMRYTPKTLTVMVGISSLNEIGDTYQVEKVEGHPGYRYDIAIIKLATEITFKNHVKPIPIVKSGKKYGDSENIMLTGWQRRDSCGPSNDKLQQIPFHTVETEKCKQFIPFLNPGYMCSMAEYEDICNIDYGGPIVSNGIQIALNPYDVECGGQFQPQLHGPLYKVATWIKRYCRLRY